MLSAGCADDKTAADTEREWVDISVTYTLNGNEVRSLPFNSSSRSVTVGVELNNENVYWTVESDAEWCSVVEEAHRGSGSFTLNITANEEFSDREPATLTFVAGQYRGREIVVTQSGNVFIVNQIYAIGSKSAGSADINVSVQEGVEWNAVGESWLKVAKGEGVAADGMVTAELHIEWEENSSSSRYGAVGLVREGEDEPDSQFNVFQFGDEMPYDEAGDIMLPSKGTETFEVKVPARSVESVICPAWIAYTTVDNADNTTSYIFAAEDNPSDTRTVRESHIALKIQDKEGEIAVPVVKQEYYAVSGITSADGLKLFAQTVNEGGDTGDWKKDGKIVLLNNIDMSQLTGEWTSIGSAEHPFGEAFDGQYRKIVNLTAAAPLFGVCEGAELKNIIIDETSKFVAEGEYMSDYTLAPLAAVLADCSVAECTNYASVTMNAGTGNTGTNTYVSGLVGRIAEGTLLSKCENYGAVTIADKCITAFQSGNFYMGGIAGSNAGTIEECSNYGAVSDAGATRDHYIGGIAGMSAGAVRSCVNGGALSVSAYRTINGALDHCRWVYMGGIVGRQNDGEVSDTTNDAPLKSVSDVKMQKIGGIIGYIAAASPVLADNVNTANGAISLDGTNTEYVGGRAVSAGGLYGELYSPLTFDFTNDKSSSAGAITCSKFEPSTGTSNVYVGGLIGFVTMPDATPDDVAPATVVKPSWSGSIKFDFSKLNTGMLVWGVGGIVGGSKREIVIRDASTNGDIMVTANTSYTMQNKTAGIGGVLGYAAAGARLSGCVNDGMVQQVVSSGRSNAYAHNYGGIVGVIVDGVSEIADCTNNGAIDNEHYNNNIWSGSANVCGSTGGIIGAYSYKGTSSASKLTVRNCRNTASVKSYRGMAGGIIGYGRNATVEDCENTGSMANGNRSYVGGIAGVVEGSTLNNCRAVCNVGGQSAGSEVFSGGGVVGILYAGSKCGNCAYFGNIVSATTTAGETAGGIAGDASADASVSDCKFGGSVRGTAISASNFSSFIVGTNLAAVAGCSYWDGK